jgi:hypothetical protein
MSADITPDAGAPAAPAVPTTPVPTTPAPAGGGALPAVTLGRPTARVRRGRATIPLACRGADCAGLLQLLRRGAGATGAARRRTVSYGSARFSARAGAVANVRVKLNRAGRALLRRRRSVKVVAKVTFSRGGGRQARFALTLKR